MPTAHTDVPPHRRPYVQFLAGVAVGILEVLCFYPLDLVKSRLQVQGVHRVPSNDTYSGVCDALVKIYRQEGLTAFWRGISTSLLGKPPKSGIKFLMLVQFRPLVQAGSQSTPWTYAMAAALCGAVEALIVNPLEVVKVTQQVHQRKCLNDLAMARQIIMRKGYGMQGLYRGITALIARNVVFQFTYFGIYANIRSRVPAAPHLSSELLRRFAMASLSGVVAFSLSAPLDTAKSRIQARQPVRGVIKYASTVQTLRTIYCEEGLRAMYKGLPPLLLRAIPGGAIQIVAYEAIFDFLKRRYSGK